MFNPKAAFVYFDTDKGDSTHVDALLVKSLQEDMQLPIIYRKNMSSEGMWTAEEFNYEGSMKMSRCFDDIRSYLRLGRLVVLPSRSFSIVRDISPEYVQKDLSEGYIQIVNTNPDNKNKFDYYAF
tara:strand:- start:206 stop:580 length:375 start_codon:yes stop_codon:yes gene_type:complete